jgi:hypothetical protein
LKRTLQERSKPQDQTVTVDKPTDIREQVQQRAYEIYEQRGMMGGSEIEDWLQAEAELHAETARKAA